MAMSIMVRSFPIFDSAELRFTEGNGKESGMQKARRFVGRLTYVYTIISDYIIFFIEDEL